MASGELNKTKKLYLFNLSTDKDNPILNFSWDWVLEFSKYFQEIHIVTTHRGNRETLNRIEITELGGGTSINRINAILKLLKILAQIFKDREKAVVFHHMSVNTAVILGLPLRIIGIRQGLWYSHSANGWKIKIASKFVSKIFTSSKSAFPIKSKKVCLLGHGILIKKYMQSTDRSLENQHKIVSIGRISPIKSLEKILYAVAESSIFPKKVTLIGPTTSKDEKYRCELNILAKRLGVELEIIGQMNQEDIPKTLSNFGIFYTGTPKSTDKAAIEAAISGCYVLSENFDTRRLVGMEEFWNSIELESLTLRNQIEIIINRPKKLASLDRLLIQKNSIQRNDLSKLVFKITDQLIKEQKQFSS